MSTKYIDINRLTDFGAGAIVPLRKSIAPQETSPAAAAHAENSYIMYGGELYKVTAAIAIGDTLSTSTNIEKTTVTDEIGDAATLNAEDVTNDKTYAMQFQLYQGKPRIVYDEI